MGAPDDGRPRIVHIIHRLDVGGLENGLVNLINNLPEDRYRHAIVCLTDYTDYARRLSRRDVTLHALHKRPGKDLPLYGRLWWCLRELRPDIVHTRNLATLEGQVVAAAAGVAGRVHGEHGWDVGDPDGTSTKNRRLRRLARPFVHRYIALSRHIGDYLRHSVGVPAPRIAQIYNGVDTRRFSPGDRPRWVNDVFGPGEHWVVGTVGRLQGIKDQTSLLRAFARLRETGGDAADRARLVVVGDGPLMDDLCRERDALGLVDRCWFAGRREDVPELMRGMDLFVLPSLAEGICNTVLEAMACGVPVVATSVGGNPELVADGVTGRLVEPGAPEALSQAMAACLAQPDEARQQGLAARRVVEEHFSMKAMVDAYAGVYDHILGASGRAAGDRRAPGDTGSAVRRSREGG